MVEIYKTRTQRIIDNRKQFQHLFRDYFLDPHNVKIGNLGNLRRLREMEQLGKLADIGKLGKLGNHTQKHP